LSNKTQAKQLPSGKNGQKNTRKTATPLLGTNSATSTPSPKVKSGNSTSHTTAEAKPTTAQAQRRLAAEEAKMRRERQKSVRALGALIALFIVVGGAAFTFYTREIFKPPIPGEEVPIMESYHLKSGTEAHPPYSTTPPTSGPHIGSLPDWGVHTVPITNELAVHVLEDAGININYQPNLDKATVDRLAALTKSYSDLVTEDSEDNHVVMAPYPGLSDPIVLTAWRHIYRLKEFDEAGIRAFIDTYKNIDHHIESGDRPANAGTPSAVP